MGFIEGKARTQGSLFPVSPDELIADDHLVRVIDLWVDRVDYLSELDAADRAEDDEAAPSQAQLRSTIERLSTERAEVISAQALLDEMAVSHHVQGEPEARLMKTAQGPSRVAWNVQSAVDGQHGLIIHHEVTDEAGDNRQLEPMAKAAQHLLAQSELSVVADAGYSNGEQLEACERAGITAFVPPDSSLPASR